MKYFIALSLFCFSCAAFGQKKAELTFNVDGVCGMCETRIEKAYDIPGILNAEWNVETKKLTVAYK
ncbi:MAG: heavy-metal-associated domain-containing protein, partial [Flavobacteriales bacterium]